MPKRISQWLIKNIGLFGDVAQQTAMSIPFIIVDIFASGIALEEASLVRMPYTLIQIVTAPIQVVIFLWLNKRIRSEFLANLPSVLVFKGIVYFWLLNSQTQSTRPFWGTLIVFGVAAVMVKLDAWSKHAFRYYFGSPTNEKEYPKIVVEGWLVVIMAMSGYIMVVVLKSSAAWYFSLASISIFVYLSIISVWGGVERQKALRE